MTEFEVTHLNKNILGLKKSNLYSPHASLKNMSKQVLIAAPNQISHSNINNTDEEDDSSSQYATNNEANNLDNYYNNLDEDIYDFSSVKRQMDDNALNNYTDEDEEEDINFDYEYGYDYERVIKDRLRKVNQEFVNDAEPSKRKSIMVSFDNAVTAIDISNETRPESTEEENKAPTAKKSVGFSEPKTVEANESNENITKKLPLNDTVHKEDPDAFANKIKQAVLRYDNEMMNQLNESQQAAVNEINGYFRETSPDFQQQDREEISKNEYKDDEFEDDEDDSKKEVQIKKDSKRSSLNSSPVFNNKSITNSQNNDLKSSTPSPPLNLTTISQNITIDKDESKQVEQSNLSSWVKFEDDDVKEDEAVDDDYQNKLKVPKQIDKKVISFSKSNEASPSPISSFRSSPEPTNSKKNETKKPLNESNENQSSLSSSSEQPTNEFKSENKNSNEKMLVEKDGIFKLMSPEEYTAYEKQKQLERQKQQAADKKLFLLLPHPPVRPKTSISTAGNRNSALKTRLITSNQTSQQNPLPARYSQSADPNGRRKEQIKNNNSIAIKSRQTPDYAQDYKSPYHIQVKSARPGIDLVEEKKKKEKEEEERRSNNDLAFKHWLKLKEDQRSREDKQKNKQKSEENSCSTGISDENRNTYEYWLLRKREQLEAEKEFKKKFEQISQQDRKTVTPEERSKAFREWITRKLKEKNEAMKMEKLENKKWIARRRRSRKHQRLSQALELAQAYGYNSSFYSPGFQY